MAPDRATRVRVESGGVGATVETVNDNAGLDGRFYVAEMPVRTALGPTTVVARDSTGEVIDSVTLG
jgi:hypothetical protein